MRRNAGQNFRASGYHQLYAEGLTDFEFWAKTNAARLKRGQRRMNERAKSSSRLRKVKVTLPKVSI